MSLPRDPLEAALALAAAFESYSVDYALGGALAYGLWGVPRATVDVDINLFVKPAELGGLFLALGSLSVSFDEERVLRESVEGGLITLRWDSFPLDLFTPSIPFCWEAARTKVRHAIDGNQAWFLSAESIAVFKLLFFRGKDLVDLERLIAVRGESLDVAYVRRWIVEMMGEDDARVVRWDALTQARL